MRGIIIQSKLKQQQLSHYAEIAKIAVPAMLESLLMVLVSGIDTKMVAALGEEAISAVSLTTQPKIFILSIFFALSTALSVFIARAKGKNDTTEAREYLFSVIKLGLAAAIILGITIFIFARPIMELVSKQKETVALSTEFFGIVMGLMFFQVASLLLNGALRGLGKTRTTLVVGIALGLVDVCFNYLLIEGRYGFPRLEVAGNAIATVLGTVSALIVSFVAVRRENFLSFEGFFSHRLFRRPKIFADIKSKAGNIVLENLSMRVGFLLSGVIVSLFPATDTAIYFVGMLLMNFSFACGDGLQSAAVAILGQKAGGGDMVAVRERLRLFLKAGAAVSICLSLAYVLLAGEFFGAYFEGVDAVNQGRMATYFVAAITFFQIERIILVASLRAVGEMKLPRQIAGLCVTVVNPATSFFLAYILGFGVTGVWQGSLITQILWCIMTFVKGKKYFTGGKTC